jgi:hypothetical protein
VSRSALREIIDYDRFRAEMSRPRFEDWVVPDGA